MTLTIGRNVTPPGSSSVNMVRFSRLSVTTTTIPSGTLHVETDAAWLS